jgi:D-arabinose 1-dehydrogenase-like Zn-dependent alcohol dehydrogenase
MRAAVMEDYGRIAMGELAEPTIQRHDDILVKVAACGVCGTDLETFDGDLAVVYGKPPNPYVLGHETTGIIEAVGTEVDGFKVGDAVVLHPFVSCGHCEGCRAGMDNHCTNRRGPGVDAVNWGGFAEYVVTGQRAAVKVPAGSDLVALSPYSDAGITAYHAIKRITPNLAPGSSVVVFGIGGVGSFAIQVLRYMAKTTIIAVEVAESRAELARTLGADIVLQGTPSEHIKTVVDATGGGANVVLDFTGATESQTAGIAMLKTGGIMSLVGTGGELRVPIIDLLMREITVQGNLVGTHGELQEVVALYEAGLRPPHIEYALDDALEAMDDLRHGRLDGRAVLVI